ncbi:MAG: response regulator, partial [Bacteroidota bacterium]|nr:response regulator [Bacteroidota bacterium]
MNTTERPVVLFVDDEAGNLAAFNAAFRKDFDVRLAQGAQEAMQALNQERIDVMITDQRMPSMTGI